MLLLLFEFCENLVYFIYSVKENVKFSSVLIRIEYLEYFELRSRFHPLVDELLNKFFFVHNLACFMITAQN